MNIYQLKVYIVRSEEPSGDNYEEDIGIYAHISVARKWQKSWLQYEIDENFDDNSENIPKIEAYSDAGRETLKFYHPGRESWYSAEITKRQLIEETEAEE